MTLVMTWVPASHPPTLTHSARALSFMLSIVRRTVRCVASNSLRTVSHCLSLAESRIVLQWGSTASCSPSALDSSRTFLPMVSTVFESCACTARKPSATTVPSSSAISMRSLNLGVTLTLISLFQSGSPSFSKTLKISLGTGMTTSSMTSPGNFDKSTPPVPFLSVAGACACAPHSKLPSNTAVSTRKEREWRWNFMMGGRTSG